MAKLTLDETIKQMGELLSDPRDINPTETFLSCALMPDYTINDACYAKGKKAVRCPSPDGYKTRAGRLAESFANGRYSNRSRAYIMSPAAAVKFEKAYAEGWDANCFTRKREPLSKTQDTA